MLTLTVHRTSRVALAFLLGVILTGCGGTKVLDEPLPLTLGQPLASAADERIEVYLDWVVVRDGPGTWARNADWDEYLVRYRNRSADIVAITSLAIFDSTLTRQDSSNQRDELVNASRLTARRYAGQGVEVKAGIGGGVLLTAGAVAGATAYGAGAAAALYMSSTAAAATLGALLVAPVLVTGGIVKGMNTRKVGNEIQRRQTPLPLLLAPGEERVSDLFFPLTPSPRKVEVVYRVGSDPAPRTLEIDTSAALDGLHLVPDR